MEFGIARSSDEATEKLGSSHYELVISDMGRPPDSRAGYTLLDALRKQGNPIPYVIYAGSNKVEHKREAIEHGAVGSTNRPDESFVLVSKGLAAVDADGVAVVDQVAGELLVADQLSDQGEMGLLDLAHIDAAQQPKQGIGMGKGVELREQQPQVVLEHGSGELGVGGTPRCRLKDEHQDTVEHQDGEAMLELVGIARVGNLQFRGLQFRGRFTKLPSVPGTVYQIAREPLPARCTPWLESRIDSLDLDHLPKPFKVLDVVRQEARDAARQHRSHDIRIVNLFATDLKIPHQFQKLAGDSGGIVRHLKALFQIANAPDDHIRR